MKKIILAILLSIYLISSEIPFDANLRVISKDTSITYSSRLNLMEFNSSKIIYILEQTYDVEDNQRTRYNNYIKYIYYW